MNLLSIIVFFVFFLVGSYLGLFIPTITKNKINKTTPSIIETNNGIYANCQNPQEISLIYSSKLILNPFINKDLDKNVRINLAIKEQVKYLQGYFYFRNHEKHQIILKEELEIENISTSKTPYSLDLNMGVDTYYPGIKKETEALLINFSINKKAIICRNSSEKFRKIKIILPLDPYLAYWNINKNDYEKRKWKNKTLNVNPCNSWRYNMLKNPTHFWYTWYPENLNQMTNCPLLYKKATIKTFAIVKRSSNKFSAIENTKMESLKKEKVIKVSFIFGFINHKKNKENFENIKTFFETYKKVSNKDINFKSLLYNINNYQIPLDPSLKALFTVLEGLNNTTIFNSNYIKIKNNSFILKSKGLFKETQKQVIIESYLGPTDAWEPKTHKEFLNFALAKSNFIFYIGHAGHGKNMNLSHHFDIQSLRTKINVKNFQHMSIISCFSSLYHTEEYLNLRSPSNYSELLIFASEGYSYHLPIAVLERYQSFLAGKDLNNSFFKKYTSKDDIYIIYRK